MVDFVVSREIINISLILEPSEAELATNFGVSILLDRLSLIISCSFDTYHYDSGRVGNSNGWWLGWQQVYLHSLALGLEQDGSRSSAMGSTVFKKEG